MHCFSSRVTSWLTWTLRVGGFVLRRRIGASVIRPSHLGGPTQHQRRAQEAVAVLGSQTIPWDRHRQIERKFCTIVGGLTTPPCGVPRVLPLPPLMRRVPLLSRSSTGALSHSLISHSTCRSTIRRATDCISSRCGIVSK